MREILIFLGAIIAIVITSMFTAWLAYRLTMVFTGEDEDLGWIVIHSYIAAVCIAAWLLADKF